MPGSLQGQLRNSVLIECLRVWELIGLDVAALRARAGLSADDLADPHGTVDFKAGAELLEAAAESAGDATLALSSLAHFRPGASGIIGQLILSAENVRSALIASQKYARLLVSHIDVEYEPVTGGARLAWCFPAAVSGRRTQMNLLFAGALVERLRLAAGPLWHPCEVEIDQRVPPESAALRLWFGPRVKPNASRWSMTVDTATLELPMPSADPALFALLANLGDRWLKDMVERPSIIVAARKAIADRLQAGHPELGDVAAGLGMSPSTFRRRLVQAGSGFEKVLEDTRAEIAETLLKTTDKRMVEIAHELGFSDQAAFTKAAARWFGTTPSSFRRQHQESSGNSSRN